MINEKSAVIKVVGIGTCGGIILEKLIEYHIYRAEYIAVHTDQNILDISSAPTRILLSSDIKSFDTDSYQVTEQIQESIKEIKSSIEGSDAVIIVAGFGGSTGTFATYLVAEAAISLGIMTIGVIITPFTYEGKSRFVRSETGIARLNELGDEKNQVFVLPNDKLIALKPFENDILEIYREGNTHISLFISDIIKNITVNSFAEAELIEIDWESKFIGVEDYYLNI